MAYEKDERDMDLDEQSNFFEEDPIYSSDTYFGERIDSAPDTEGLEEDETMEEDLVTETDAMPAGDEAQGFGEKMPSDSKSKSNESMEDDPDKEWSDLEDD